ncbi:DUF2637 domain-containing protein [Streptomyces violascens]|uniref:DUF2637 domain-containing protein n=1 Tax=Streptomyces violascens TaxID=67381 RepID=UPI00365B4D1B
MISAGGLIIALIGFIGSYAAVQDLAETKGFGDFARLYPIGVDAGIVVLLALDLLLSWIRIPFPLLRQTAWLLTAATIAFNAAAAWPDPLGTAMHAVIPVLFVVTVEAARHAVGRIADITADRHMEGVRLSRWILSPVPTFRMWRRMKLWELRSYDQVIKLEQDRLIYEAGLEVRYGPAWRRTAPIEALMPLRLAKYGVPVQTDGPPAVQRSNAPELPAPLPDRSEGTPPAGEPLPAGPPSSTPQEGPPPVDPPPPPQEGPPADPPPPKEEEPPAPPVDGRAAVKTAYDALTSPDADLSARKLAQRLAPSLGLTENTVRVYITALRKERSRLKVVPDPTEEDAPAASETTDTATPAAAHPSPAPPEESPHEFRRTQSAQPPR